ncbi:hypothetical protein LSPH24S_10131 [Lysinibacillus sphaericus]
MELYAVQKNEEIIAFLPFTVKMLWGVRIYAFTGEKIAHYTGIVAQGKSGNFLPLRLRI